MYISISRYRIYPMIIGVLSLFGSTISPIVSRAEGQQQKFLVTAYYSPLPDQCCYFRGNYDDEITFNGNGTHGADGTPVYPGMIAAPASYAFGTQIELPGLGIGTVHDRGGRIIEWDDVHRIDIWMGEGEEGLARALEWGARYVTGTVNPSPMGSDSIDLTKIASSPSTLKNFAARQSTVSLLLADAAYGETSSSVRTIQTALAELGYFDHDVTGQFGDVTKQAILHFTDAYALDGIDGMAATDGLRAWMLAAQDLADDRVPEIASGLSVGMHGQNVIEAKRLLRYLGAYKGRTSDRYDESLREQVIAFQIGHGVIGNYDQAGAGVIGPKTQSAIIDLWKKKEMKRLAKEKSLQIRIAKLLDQSLPNQTLARGESGDDVRSIQRFLSDLGFFNRKDINGTYGEQTEEAVYQYQISRAIVASKESVGAGVVDPVTSGSLEKDLISSMIRMVRAMGVDAVL